MYRQFLAKKPLTPAQFVESQLVYQVKKENFPQAAIDGYKTQFDEVAKNLRQNPVSLNDWNRLGTIKKIIGDYQGAEMAWLKANDINPKNSTSFGALGDLYGFELKQPAKSEQMYLTAIANDPKEMNWYLSLSEVYRYAYPEKQNLTVDILLRGLAELPDNPTLVANLATYYKDTNDISKAIEWYEKLVKISPDNVAAKQDLAELKTKAQQP